MGRHGNDTQLFLIQKEFSKLVHIGSIASCRGKLHNTQQLNGHTIGLHGPIADCGERRTSDLTGEIVWMNTNSMCVEATR